MKFLLLIPLLALGLAGCYEDMDVTLHEPGVYKGSDEAQIRTDEERAEILERRFKQVQTDR
jgi:hypothetical protein